MSRIGKVPVTIPDKVEVKLNGLHVVVKGPKGQLEYNFGKGITFKQEGKEIVVSPLDDSPKSKAMWGTARTIVSNMVVGVSAGFTTLLEFNGVGYKATVSGNTLNLSLGYSHPIDFKLPNGVEAKVNKNEISISGADKELVGFVAAKVRSFRPPEPYKGKGVKYVEEKIMRKAGKTGAKK